MKASARLAFVLAAGALTAAVAPACEFITHPNDFEVDAGVPFVGFCNECPEGEEDLRRPPCPADHGTGDDGNRYVFASRYLHFGKPEEWRDKAAESFHLGFDLDCSAHPQGTPVLCRETTPDAGPMVPWEPLPHGIDNSLMQRIFGPLYDTARAAHQDVDLDREFSHQSGAVILIISGWNGEPDDDHIVFNIASSPGLSKDNGPARWDGTDKWDLYPTGPAVQQYFTISDAEGYVSNGQVVVDYRSRGAVSLRFGTAQTSFRILLHDVVFAGDLRKDKLSYFTMSALADVASALESVDDAKKVLGACDPLAEAYLGVNLPPLLIGAADMPSDPSHPASDPCDAISFAWAIDAQPALLGGRRNPDIGDGGCSL